MANDLEGDGLLDRWIALDYSKSASETLSRLGGDTITRITLSRAPIKSFLRKALNFISFGGFEKAISSYGIDRIFHLSMIVELGGKRVVVEKNATVVVSSSIKHEPDAEFKEVPLNGKIITLKELLEKTKKDVGIDTFFKYNYSNNNCQNFIDNILKSNGLLTPDIHSWLFQSLPDLEKKLGLATHAVHAITDVGAVASRLVGQGLSPLDALVQAHVICHCEPPEPKRRVRARKPRATKKKATK